MVNITLSIPEDLKKELQARGEVNWSAVVRNALRAHLRKVKIADAIAAKSKLTKKDVEELDRLVKSSMAKELGLK
jgi:Arc/MetJ-type ribon-helix-helix transcriptional regulator